MGIVSGGFRLISVRWKIEIFLEIGRGQLKELPPKAAECHDAQVWCNRDPVLPRISLRVLQRRRLG
jgi:hypothetical protein